MLEASKESTGEKPWKGICCKACWDAKHDKCRCRCKGQNHQRGRVKAPESEEDFKKLADAKSKNPEITEKICRLLEDALKQHPEWAKSIEDMS